MSRIQNDHQILRDAALALPLLQVATDLSHRQLDTRAGMYPGKSEHACPSSDGCPHGFDEALGCVGLAILIEPHRAYRTPGTCSGLVRHARHRVMIVFRDKDL